MLNRPSGIADWIYWVPLQEWRNAVVFNDHSQNTSLELRPYFLNVHSVTVRSLDDLADFVTGLERERLSCDLVVSTYLLQHFIPDKPTMSRLIQYASRMLSSRGVIVCGYTFGWKLVGSALDRMLGNRETRRWAHFFRWDSRERLTNRFCLALRRSHCFRTVDTLYVFPSYETPWTISNSAFLGRGVRDWKKKTRGNAPLLWFMSSPWTTRLFKYWWPQRILVAGKHREHCIWNC